MSEDKQKLIPKVHVNHDEHEDNKLTECYLQDGPAPNRKCTDILCCILFCVYWVGMLYLGYQGYKHGDPSKLAIPYDPDHHACGVDPGYEDYGKIYFVAPTPKTLHRTVCVSECPTNQTKVLDCKVNSQVKTCEAKYDSNINNTVMIYPTIPLFDRMCLPMDKAKFKQIADELHLDQASDQYMADIKATWKVIASVAVGAIVVGIIFMVLLRCFAGLITWLFITAFLACMGALGYFLFFKAVELQKQVDAGAPEGKALEEEIKKYKYGAYGIWGFTALALLTVFCMFDKIRVAIGVVKSAALFVAEVKTSLLIPPVMLVLLTANIAYCVVIGLYIYSSGEPNTESKLPFAQIKFDDNMNKKLAYHVFGSFWGIAMCMSLSQFIIASTCVLWYFKVNTMSHVLKSTYFAFRYHLGSLAFGSLILAVVWSVKVVLEIAVAQAKSAGAEQSKIMEYVINCLRCAVDCFERFIRFLNKNAYIQIALTSENFCTSARAGFFLFLRNMGRFGFTAGIGEIFTLMGKLAITAISTAAGYFYLTRKAGVKDTISSPIAPTICCAIASYIIASVFMEVYGLAIDAILQCFLCDEELKERNPSHESRAPAPLKDLINGK